MNSAVWSGMPSSRTPHETLRSNRCWASSAMDIRWWRVSSRNALARPTRASSRSASDASSAASTSAIVRITVISSRSTLTSGAATFHSSGRRPVNQPRTRSRSSFVIMIT